MVVITSFPPPEEGIKHRQPNTRAILNDKDLGSGTLFIAESRISWIESATGSGFSLEYPHVSLHAVCRDLMSFPEECLYLMLDEYITIENGTGTNGDVNNDDDEEDEEEDEKDSSELRFIPQDKSCLNSMYNAMSDCQALHPDPNDSLSQDSESEEENDGEEEEDANHRDAHVNGDMEMEVEGQFDNAEL